jgi:hypothetical protein
MSAISWASCVFKGKASAQWENESVTKSIHDSKAGGGHLGIKRTYEAIKQKYYFKGMYNFIQNYILSCDICQRVKRNTQARNAPLHPLGMIWAGMVSCNIKEFAKYGNNFWKKILSSLLFLI